MLIHHLSHIHLNRTVKVKERRDRYHLGREKMSASLFVSYFFTKRTNEATIFSCKDQTN